VKTAYDAINYMNNKKHEKTTSKYTSTKRVTELPDWYDEYQETLKQKPSEAKTVVLSNKKELLDLVKEMFD